MDLDLRAPLVLGCGLSGRAAARFLRERASAVTIIEKSLECVTQEVLTWQREGIELIHESVFCGIAGYSLVVTSPGLSPNHPILVEAKNRGLPIIGEMELGLRFLKNPAIGITGTNGKTSVTLLTSHVLNACSLPSRTVGNIGIPLTQALSTSCAPINTQEIFVIEMSSYQLEGLKIPCLDQAMILNITPNHLERHGTMESYARAKCWIAQCLKSGGVLHLHVDVDKEYGCFLEGVKQKKFTPHHDHHRENQAAAFALCQAYGVDKDAFIKAAVGWNPPAHRITFVREKEGVRYYNDSKGTNLAAVEKAVASVPGPVLLLAGGVHKGASYLPWIKSLKGKVRHFFVFGQAALQMQEELGAECSVTRADSLYEALHMAAAEAHFGETVLLSPGCSSFDMFRDYVHRGESFEKWVMEL